MLGGTHNTESQDSRGTTSISRSSLVGSRLAATSLATIGLLGLTHNELTAQSEISSSMEPHHVDPTQPGPESLEEALEGRQIRRANIIPKESRGEYKAGETAQFRLEATLDNGTTVDVTRFVDWAQDVEPFVYVSPGTYYCIGGVRDGRKLLYAHISKGDAFGRAYGRVESFISYDGVSNSQYRNSYKNYSQARIVVDGTESVEYVQGGRSRTLHNVCIGRGSVVDLGFEMLSNRDNTWKDFSHDTDVQYFIGDRDIPDFLEHLTDGKFRVGVNAPDIPTGVLLKARYGRQEASVKVTLLPEHPIDRIEILCSGEYVERERIEPLVLAYPTDGSAPRDITKKCSMVFDRRFRIESGQQKSWQAPQGTKDRHNILLQARWFPYGRNYHHQLNQPHSTTVQLNILDDENLANWQMTRGGNQRLVTKWGDDHTPKDTSKDPGPDQSETRFQLLQTLGNDSGINFPKVTQPTLFIVAHDSMQTGQTQKATAYYLYPNTQPRDVSQYLTWHATGGVKVSRDGTIHAPEGIEEGAGTVYVTARLAGKSLASEPVFIHIENTAQTQDFAHEVFSILQEAGMQTRDAGELANILAGGDEEGFIYPGGEEREADFLTHIDRRGTRLISHEDEGSFSTSIIHLEFELGSEAQWSEVSVGKAPGRKDYGKIRIGSTGGKMTARVPNHMNTIHIKLKEFRSGQWVSEYITLHRHATEISPLQTLGATSNKLLSGEDVRMHAAQFAGHRPELDARVFLDHSDTFASVSFALQSLGIRVNDFAGKIETPYGLFDMLGSYQNSIGNTSGVSILDGLEPSQMMQKIPVGSLIFFADPDMNMEGWNKPGTLATRNSMKFFATHGHVGIYTGNGLMYHISDGSGTAPRLTMMESLYRNLRGHDLLPYAYVDPETAQKLLSPTMINSYHTSSYVREGQEFTNRQSGTRLLRSGQAQESVPGVLGPHREERLLQTDARNNFIVDENVLETLEGAFAYFVSSPEHIPIPEIVDAEVFTLTIQETSAIAGAIELLSTSLNDYDTNEELINEMANVAIAKINVLKKAIASGIKDDDALLNLYTPGSYARWALVSDPSFFTQSETMAMGYALGDMSRVGTIQDVWNMIKTEGRFNTWYAEEKEDMSWTEGLPFCPMVFDREEQITWLENATAPKVIGGEITLYPIVVNPDGSSNYGAWGEPDSGPAVTTFHPGATFCIRSKTQLSAAQCCYDEANRVVDLCIASGSADSWSSNFLLALPHYITDVRPYNKAQTLDRGKCGLYTRRYFEVRPNILK